MLLSPDGASIKIAQMRSALRSDMRKASGTPMSIIVFQDAHKLTVEAGNAILKWVEEPFDGRLFLFLTHSPSSLLPTLQSRCVKLVVENDDEDMLASGTDDASLASRFGMSGDPGRFAEIMNLVLEWVNAWATSGNKVWHTVFDRMGKMNLNSDESLIVVDLFIAALRDVSAVSVGGAPKVYVMHKERILKLAQSPFSKKCADFAVRLSALRRRLQSHVNMQLAIEAMMIEMHSR